MSAPSQTANKAAEEGELPASDYHEILDEVLSPYGMQRYLNGDAIEMYAANLREIIDLARNDAADRASRQVANKAEVEPEYLKRYSIDAKGLPYEDEFGTWVAYTDLSFATPPATTGASTARDQVLEEAAAICDKKYELRAASGHPREASAARNCAAEIRALKSEVAAQAGQVAVPENMVMMPKEPSHLMIAAMACSKAKDDEGEFSSMLDLLDFSGENKAHAVLKAAYHAAVAAAPSPAKESK